MIASAVTETRDAAGEATSRFLGALFASPPSGSLIEVRFRVPDGMAQRFFPGRASQPAVNAVLTLASRTDVYVGVLPRIRRRGRVEDVAPQGGVVWADCDTEEAASALESFEPRASMIVASGGSGSRRHAYWLLDQSLDLSTIEALNRRLALALGADGCVVTRPHTILRPAGSLNWKHSPPSPVSLIELRDRGRVRSKQLDNVLPPESALIEPPRPVATWSEPCQTTGGDPLRSISPPVYVERLTGLHVGRSHKVRCPFHDDRTPSLHVYGEPERGWYCFGCGRGRSIFDFGAFLWQIGHPSPGRAGPYLDPREFLLVRQRLATEFGIDR